MKKIFYNTVGGVSLSLGILGVFLPLLPTSCFILLASWAFAKSSPTFHAWLKFKSPFANSIQAWQENRVIPKKVKWIATTSIMASYIISFLLIDNIYVLVGLTIGLSSLVIYLISKPSEAKNVTYQQFPKLHPQVI